MRITDTNVYVGPNIYARFPVIRHVLDLGELEHWPTVRLGDDYVARLLEMLPGLADHGCSYQTAGGFVRRMREDKGTWLGHVMEHVAIELQNVAGSDVSFGRTRSVDGRPGFYNMVFEYHDEEVGREAGRIALEILHHLLPTDLRPDNAPGDDWDFEAERDQFIKYAQRRELGPSTASLARAAEARDIPWIRLNRYSLLQLGHGRFQKRIQATVTGNTSNIAVDLAGDKQETNEILRDLGLPVPRQIMVRTPGQSVRAANRIGYPVVLKPLSGNHGRGVSINLTDDESVKVAFDKAKQHGQTVVVETCIEGMDHRILVVNGKVVAAAKRVPGHVVGDGQSTIEALVEEVNKDPRRGVGHEKVLTRLEFDDQADRLLARLGYNRSTVPAADEVVYLRATANLSTGGTAIDVTDIIHPDNQEMAVRAIMAIGLDVGGVDFLTSDIAESYRVTGGAICEVNAGPGFRMHVAPSEGTPRDVAGPVVEMLFPPGSAARIPIAAVTGTNGKTTTARMLAHILKMKGHVVGMTTTDGVYIDGQLSVEGDMTGPVSARMILRDPAIDAAVLETARGGMIRSGLGFSECNVSCCLNVASDHLGMKGIDTLDQLAELKRVPIEVAQDAAILNADDPRCLQMADYTDARHVCYVTMNPAHALVKEHIQAGGRAVVLEQGMNGYMITIYDNMRHIPLMWTHLIPATLEGRAIHNVQNAMFAAAMAYNMDVSLEHIMQGLRTFGSGFFQAPGRMNVFDEHPFKVILDYAHNPAAVKAMCDVIDRLGVVGKRIVALSAPGDRRDEDIADIAAAAAGHFDIYVLKRDDYRRGRGDDEVPKMLRNTLLANGVPDDSIHIIPDEQEATQKALEFASPGDVVLILGDKIKRCWKQIIYFKPGDQPASDSQSIAARGPAVDVPGFELPDDLEIIRDERGVRLAREEAD
ncbi:MAG: cyanophycin synthetase [Gammaproteobacteria bacterium]|nr:cyanophycin synthetase [Gammaproteobacteria bacterium]